MKKKKKNLFMSLVKEDCAAHWRELGLGKKTLLEAYFRVGTVLLVGSVFLKLHNRSCGFNDIKVNTALNDIK